MTNDTALVAHLTTLFADPHTADLHDVVVSDDYSVFVLVGDFDPQTGIGDDEWVETLALRSLDFLGEQSIGIIRQRWFDEGYWKNWCHEDNDEDDL